MSIEAMKQALEALEDARLHIFLGDKKGVEANIRANYAYESLRQAIAKAEKQDGNCQRCGGKGCIACDAREAEGISIKSIEHPIGPQADGDINPDSLEEIEIDLPKREWVGLTDDDVFEALTFVDKETKRVPFMLMRFAVAIQAKLKEKNNG